MLYLGLNTYNFILNTWLTYILMYVVRVYTEYTNQSYMNTQVFQKLCFVKNTEKGKITTHPIPQNF